ncbi:MAG: GNAT family N-acetyltransferase [Candidatus Hodarchaeota archaeon]
MLYELQLEKFQLIEPLCEMDFHLLPPVIINGKISGRAWVDNPDKPKSALIWDKQYSLSLLGDENNSSFNSSLEQLLDEIIVPDALSREFREGWLSCPKRWGKKIENNELLPGRFPMRHEREYYVIHQSTGVKWENSIPPSFSLERITDDFLKRTDLENFGNLTDMITLRWNSAENFLRWGFGVCLVSGDNAVVSYCLSMGNFEGRCDVEIETMEGYQRQGYGSLVARAFVDYALEEGYTEIGWDSFARNKPSIDMALKLGFKKREEHVCYSGKYLAKSQ